MNEGPRGGFGQLQGGNTFENVEAIVLAGAINDGPLEAISDAPHEALILLMGRPMVHYVLDALTEARSVSRVLVVGPDASLGGYAASKPVETLQSSSSMVENLRIGVEALKPSGSVLVVTADIPLISAEAIDDFVRRCSEVPADIYYPVVPKEVNDERFPGVKRTYVRLKEGVFTGGNMALIKPEIVGACHQMIAKAVAMRKKPWQLSRMLGFKFIFKLLFNRLTLKEIEDRVRLILGFRGVGVVSPYPEVGIDVDKPDDYVLAEAVLKGREEGKRASE